MRKADNVDGKNAEQCHPANSIDRCDSLLRIRGCGPIHRATSASILHRCASTEELKGSRLPGICYDCRMPLFVVIRPRGEAWQPGLPLEGQTDWAGHASFMDALAEKGF